SFPGQFFGQEISSRSNDPIQFHVIVITPGGPSLTCSCISLIEFLYAGRYFSHQVIRPWRSYSSLLDSICSFEGAFPTIAMSSGPVFRRYLATKALISSKSFGSTLMVFSCFIGMRPSHRAALRNGGLLGHEPPIHIGTRSR